MAWPFAQRSSLVLGTYGSSLLRREFSVGPAEIATHKHVIGLTGQGKSRLLASMFAQLVSAGEACALIDPHADLAQDALALLAERGFFDQVGASDKLLVIDFSRSDRFLPFNVLAQRYSSHDVARNVVEACKRAWPALSGGSAPQFENILLAGTFVLIESRQPLTMLPRLLTDADFRERMLRAVSDPEIVGFFHHRFDRWGRDAPMMIESTLRRVFLLTFSPALRYALGQRENGLDFRKLMDQKVSIIFNLGGLDEETQRFLGCLLTVGFEVAALSRTDTPRSQRTNYHLIIDEFSQFSAQSEEALARVLSLARKYCLYLTLAHQTWSQLSSRLHGALQNATEIAFRLGRSDAEWAAPIFGNFDPHAVKHVVLDPDQVERTHPVFYTVQETYERWTARLMELQPRHALVKMNSRIEMIRTLDASPSPSSVRRAKQIIEADAQRLLRPRPGTDSTKVQDTRTVRRIFREEE